MKPMPLSQIAHWTGGRLHGADVVVDAVATDTRAMPAAGRALFVALKGERFDGHDHLAATNSIVAALVSRQLDITVPQVVVADTERALAAIAGAMQRERATRVVAITGSNGKTSVKQLVLSILRRVGRACANPGNRNNEIGLPLAVIDAPEEADFAIYEMGAGKPGDIAYLTAIAPPDVALVNNVAAAHLERMGSLSGIADTKAAIYDALPANGVAVLNADDAFAPFFEQRVLAERGRRLIRFGLDSAADLGARDIALRDDGSDFTLVMQTGEAQVSLPLPGRHNVANALAAAALALGCGVALDDIAAGLRAAEPVAGRFVRHHLGSGASLIDDSYNANPGSLDAAIDALAAMPGEHWLVLGDMRELGADAQALHAEAGRRAQAAGIARLYALGALSARAAEAFGAGGRAFDAHDTLAATLRRDLETHVGAAMAANALHPIAAMAAPTVLVKGSRGSAMDRVVNALLQGETAHVA